MKYRLRRLLCRIDMWLSSKGQAEVRRVQPRDFRPSFYPPTTTTGGNAAVTYHYGSRA